MSVATHTPGPWSYAVTTNAGAASGGVIGLVVGPGIKYRDRMQGFTVADARLIAAAPDMLDALEIVLIDPDFPKLNMQTRDVITAAVAKATGFA